MAIWTLHTLLVHFLHHQFSQAIMNGVWKVSRSGEKCKCSVHFWYIRPIKQVAYQCTLFLHFLSSCEITHRDRMTSPIERQLQCLSFTFPYLWTAMTDVKSRGDPGIYKKNRHFIWYSEIKSRRYPVWSLVHGIETVFYEMISLFFYHRYCCLPS